MTTTELAPPRPAPLARTARHGAANLAGAALAGLAGLGVTFLAARSLGPVAAGSFFAATSAFTLVGGLARLGTLTSLVYWPARLRARDTPDLIRPYLRAGLLPVAVVSTALAAGVFVLAPVAVPDYAAPLRLLALFLPVAALADASLAATRGMRKMRPTVLLDKMVRPGTQLLLVGLLALAAEGAGLRWWALAWVFAYVPVAVATWVLLARSLPARSPAPQPAVAREFWRFTAPRAVANAAQTALQRVDVLLIAAIAGLAPAAAYAVAGRFVVLGQLANGSISQAVQPRLAESLARDEIGVARELYQTATSWLILTTWPLHMLVIRYAADYLGVFGPTYARAVPVVWILAAAMLVGTGCGMVDMVLTMAGRTSWNLANVLAALAVTIVLDLLLIPRLGVVGAAIGLAGAVLINNLVPLAQVIVSLRLHPFGASTALAAGLTLACFGLLPLLFPAPLAGIPISVAAYLLALYRLRAVLHLPSLINRTGLTPNP